MNVGPVELLLIAVLAIPTTLVPLLLLYWVVRLAVRHGMRDAESRGAERVGDAGP
jgi:hypothetical protein